MRGCRGALWEKSVLDSAVWMIFEENLFSLSFFPSLLSLSSFLLFFFFFFFVFPSHINLGTAGPFTHGINMYTSSVGTFYLSLSYLPFLFLVESLLSYLPEGGFVGLGCGFEKAGEINGWSFSNVAVVVVVGL